MVKPEDVKRVAKYAAGVLGVITIAVVGTIFGVKSCNGENKKDKEDPSKACVSCDSLRNDLVASRDSVIMLQDSLQSVCDSAYVWKTGRDSLQLENDSLKNVADSLNLELTDCQNSKQPVVVAKPAAKTATKKPTQQKPAAKPVASKPAASKPVAPKPAEQKPCEKDPVPSAEKVIIENAYEGGVINNYFGEQKAAEQKFIEEYKKAERQYKNGYVLTGERVRCK